VQSVDGQTGAVTLDYLADAPGAGGPYGRQSGAWVEMAGSGGISDAPSDGTPYARQDAAWLALGTAATTDAGDYVQTESDPVYAAAPAAGITAQDLIDWAAAYGWGDHAGLYEPAGVSAADVTDLDDDAATLDIGPSASVFGSNTGDQDLSSYIQDTDALTIDGGTP